MFSVNSELPRVYRPSPTCASKLQQRRWCPTDDVEVPWNEVARGFEYAKGQYVVLTDEDFEQLPLPSKHTIELNAFVGKSTQTSK